VCLLLLTFRASNKTFSLTCAPMLRTSTDLVALVIAFISISGLAHVLLPENWAKGPSERRLVLLSLLVPLLSLAFIVFISCLHNASAHERQLLTQGDVYVASRRGWKLEDRGWARWSSNKCASYEVIVLLVAVGKGSCRGR
jgi:hypothetical protein